MSVIKNIISKIKNNKLLTIVVIVLIVISIVIKANWQTASNIWDSITIKNFDKSIYAISHYCRTTQKTENISELDILGSKRALVNSGFSESFIDKYFRPIEKYDSDLQVSYITWNFCVNDYSGSVNVVKYNKSNRFEVSGNNKEFSDFENTISHSDALKKMIACGGVVTELIPENSNNKNILSVQLGYYKDYYYLPNNTKLLNAPILVSIPKNELEYYGAGIQVVPGSKVYVNLIDGSCYTANYRGPV